MSRLKFRESGGVVNRILATVFLSILALGAALGHTFRGAINGSVTDQSGAVIAGANVTATDTATNVAHRSVTTNDGQFSFQDLPLGTYTVMVTAAGFQQTSVSNIVVTAGNV